MNSVSTLEPKCFDNYQTAQEVVPYFEEVVALFKQLDTYQALANANPPVRPTFRSFYKTLLLTMPKIVPDNSKKYDLIDLQNAVSDAYGYTPDVRSLLPKYCSDFDDLTLPFFPFSLRARTRMSCPPCTTILTRRGLCRTASSRRAQRATFETRAVLTAGSCIR